MALFLAIVVFLLIGLISGWIASQMMEGHGLGPTADAIVGVIGSLVGGFIFDIFRVTAYGFGGALVMSVFGAIVFLWLANLFPHRQGPRRPIGHA